MIKNYIINQNKANLSCNCCFDAYWKEWRKGKDLLMKIFRRILNIYKKEVVFKIIGKIEVEKDLKNHCILYDNKTQIAEVFNSAHCMVMTSRLENLTQTICEALSRFAS